MVSFTHPHDPYAIPQEYWDRYRDDDIPMPVARLRRVDHRTRTSERLREVCAMDDVEITDDDGPRRARHAYSARSPTSTTTVARLLEHRCG